MDINGLINKHIYNRMKSLQTVEVVVVESVDYTKWKCSVRPKPRINVRGDVQNMPIILDVPMASPKSGGSVIMMPIEVGDIGMCVFSKHALDTLLINKDTTEVTIPREFDINDAMYIAGVYTETENIPTVSVGETLIHNQSGSLIRFYNNGEMVLSHKSGSYIKFYASGNIEIKANNVYINEL